MRDDSRVGFEPTTQIILVSTYSSKPQASFAERALSRSCVTHFSVRYSVQCH
jgi:hypothetical protein